MRAVSFFGAAAFCVIGSGVAPAAAAGAGAGFSGTVGFGAPGAAAPGGFGGGGAAALPGGFGGGTAPLIGGFGGGAAPASGGLGGGVAPLNGGFGAPGAAGADGGGFGAGGGGTKGFAPAGGAEGGGADGGGAAGAGGVATPAPVGSFVVSFFGAVPPSGAPPGEGLPGTLIRTVSRFTAGCSLFGGSVIRMVSLFVTSSDDSEGAGGISSAINCGVVYLTRFFQCQYTIASAAKSRGFFRRIRPETPDTAEYGGRAHGGGSFTCRIFFAPARVRR